MNREILGIALRRAGHSVEFAHNGQEAIERVRGRRFDVVLMDVQMPVMDGVQATRRIRSLGGEFASLPILGLTASVMAHERESYLAAGMDACLRKPIVWDELWSALGRFAGARPSPPSAGTANTDATEPVLVDGVAIDKLRKLAGSPALARMLASTLETAQQCCEGLQRQDEPADVVAQAHRLKGTAGTFGLDRLSALARRIEALAAAHEDFGPSVEALRRTLQDTRLELQRLALIAAEPAG
ncbi:response regulator [Ramlibacter sp. MMS24-I3-19]|uniref:response regulator n=1 Tax=Ramlibacter sp. MMS24-I3-19 TaxID=3416606 RepID=UPI003D054F72